MRGGNARSAEICRPDGVTRTFQVIRYKVEPLKGSFCGNLFAKDCCRLAGSDEPEPCRPEMAFVVEALVRAGVREGLAWAGPRPDGAIVRPASLPEREAPAADAGEEVDLGVWFEVIRGKVTNIAGVDHAGRDVPALDQIAQPLCGIRVDLIIERLHQYSEAKRIVITRRVTSGSTGLGEPYSMVSS